MPALGPAPLRPCVMTEVIMERSPGEGTLEDTGLGLQLTPLMLSFSLHCPLGRVQGLFFFLKITYLSIYFN